MLIPNLQTNVTKYISNLNLDYKSSDAYLSELEVYNVLEMAGINVCQRYELPVVCSQESRVKWAEQAIKLAKSNGKLVLKVIGRTILHKSDAGGVKILSYDEIEGFDDILSIADEMIEIDSAIEGILAAEFIPHKSNIPGQELLLSFKQDPAFGPVIVIGVGGLLTEWYGKATQNLSRLIMPAENFKKPATVMSG